MIYWTKRLVDEDGMFTGELDTIKEFFSNNGFGE